MSIIDVHALAHALTWCLWIAGIYALGTSLMIWPIGGPE